MSYPAYCTLRKVAVLALLAILIVSAVRVGVAQAEWPERPVRFVVPFTAGSSSDIVARLVAVKLGERLGQQFVVENRVGAGGGIGTELVARAEPDGYTIGLANTSTHAVAASLGTQTYDPVKDFTPVSLLGSSPFVLALYPGVPAKSVAELIALAKAKPRALNYASAGPATLAHLSGALFTKMAQIEITHVPYRGTAQSTLDLLEGRVEMQFGTIPPALAHIVAGRLRALAVTSAARNSVLPNVPTMAESGLTGYEASLWQAIVLPAAAPPAIVARLNREVTAVLNDPDVKANLGKQGVETESGTPEALAGRIRDDVKKWRDVVTSAGISASEIDTVHDILIRGGTLFDGTGSAGITTDLAVANGRIAAIGPKLATSAAKTIDATGLAIAPGFIDIKTHSDFTLPINPKAESKVRQGVTTEIIGHCGFSVAPALAGKVELLRDYLSPSAPWLPFRELTFPGYLDTFPATAVNAGMLVGHNTLRLMVMGMDNRVPASAELDAMVALLEDGLNAGALGMSSGLFTPPGSYAQPAEMQAFGHVLKRHNAGYFTHLRDESNDVLEAVQEAIEVAERCSVHVEIVHFKCSGMDNWGKVAKALRMIDDAKARGLDVDCDFYPYAAGSNPLKNLLPQWVQSGGVPAMLERLKHPDTRARIRIDVARDGLNNWGRIPSWDCVQISISPNLPQFSGRTIASLAAERKQDPIDTWCDYLIEDKGATRVLVTSISEDDIETIVASPFPLVGSDGNCVAPYGDVGKGMPHPRFYGTFPRIIHHYVHERGTLALERAINKMTGATARALKLKDRGLLKENYCADIVIFDPVDFRDLATYAEPHRFPSGVRTTVIVNGVLVVDKATHVGTLPGRVLRRDRDGAVA